MLLDRPFTLNDLRAARTSGKHVSMLTCYDYTTARHLEMAGVNILLVGDSAANVILGHPSTLPISLNFLIELTAAVKRGAPNCLVMGDMPFGSYHASDAQAIDNVSRMVKETHCDAVKIEASSHHLNATEKLAGAGVAVVVHLGLRPQTVGLMGGYKFQGRTAREARALVDEARRFAGAGAAAILLEAVPPEVSQRLVETVEVPVIGCGGGPACQAHVVVLQDLLRQTSRQPKFVPQVELRPTLIETVQQYVNLIESGAYPSMEHCYAMPEAERARFVNGTTASR